MPCKTKNKQTNSLVQIWNIKTATIFFFKAFCHRRHFHGHSHLIFEAIQPTTKKPQKIIQSLYIGWRTQKPTLMWHINLKIPYYVAYFRYCIYIICHFSYKPSPTILEDGLAISGLKISVYIENSLWIYRRRNC